MLKHIVQPGRPQMICRLRLACWIPVATHTHSECVMPIAFPLQHRLHERASLLRCTFIALRLPSPLQRLRSQFSFFPQLRLTVTEHIPASYCLIWCCNNTKMNILHWNTALCRCWRVLTPSCVAVLKLQSNMRVAIIPFHTFHESWGPWQYGRASLRSELQTVWEIYCVLLYDWRKP